MSGRSPRAGPEETEHTSHSSWLTWVANSFLPHNPLLFKENSLSPTMRRHLPRCGSGPLGRHRPPPQGACQMKRRRAAGTCWHPPILFGGTFETLQLFQTICVWLSVQSPRFKSSFYSLCLERSSTPSAHYPKIQAQAELTTLNSVCPHSILCPC